MHTRDLKGLFRFALRWQVSGTLHLFPVASSSWQARVTLVQGHPTTCDLDTTEASSVVVDPLSFIRQFEKSGLFTWSLEPLKENASLEQGFTTVPPLPPATSWLTPAERAPSPPSSEEQEGMGAWTVTDRPYRLLQDMPACSRPYRMTFALADGQRTVQEIADLLHKTCEQMSTILNECYRSGWIGKSHHS